MDIKLNIFDKFCCIAGRCPMTCCMQWKIAVDEDTYRQWSQYQFRDKTLTSYVKGKKNSYEIALKQDHFCPFLNPKKLCQLVVEHGEHILSHACDVFPRQIQSFENRTEYSLVPCCPAVIDLLCQVKKPEWQDGAEEFGDLYAVRKFMADIISNTDYSLSHGFLMAYFVLLDIYEQKEPHFDTLAKEYDAQNLKKLNNQIVCMESFWEDTLLENNEIWLDMVENYRKEGLYEEYIEKISKLAEQISEEPGGIPLSNAFWEFEGVFQEYEELLRKFFILEIYSNMLIRDSDLESMVVMMQWFSLEYVMIRQGLFLHWLNKDTISYEAVREHIVVVARMTGYDLDDIYEYLENSFNELIWQWSYMAFLIGTEK